MTKVVDGSGTTSFQYDHRGNMLVKRQAVGTSTTANLSYAYNLADQVTQVTYPSGRIVGYVRDTKQRVTTVRTKATSSVTAWTNLATSMQYEVFGSLKQATLGNTLSMTNNWGNDGRLASRRLYKTSGGANLSLLNYAYDNDDNITGISDAVTAANSTSYAYDVRGRLAQLTLAATSPAPYKRTDWLHDANGNRTGVERVLPHSKGTGRIPGPEITVTLYLTPKLCQSFTITAGHRCRRGQPIGCPRSVQPSKRDTQ